MKIVFGDPKKFLAIIRAMETAYGNTLNVTISEEGILFTVMDPARVIMGRLQIDKEEFHQFDVNFDSEPLQFGLEVGEANIKWLEKLGEGSLIWDQDTSETRKMTMVDGVRSRSLEGMVVTEFTDVPMIEGLEFVGELKIIGTTLLETAKAMDAVEDSATLEISPDEVIIFGQKVRERLGAKFEEILENTFTKKFSVKFNIELFKDVLTAACAVGEAVTIKLAKDSPLFLSSELGVYHFQGFVAPFVEPTE